MFDLQCDSEQTSGCMHCTAEGCAPRLRRARWVVLGVPELGVTLRVCPSSQQR